MATRTNKQNDENTSHNANLASKSLQIKQQSKGVLQQPSQGVTIKPRLNDSSVVLSPVSAKNVLPTRLRPNRRVRYVFVPTKNREAFFQDKKRKEGNGNDNDSEAIATDTVSLDDSTQEASDQEETKSVFVETPEDNEAEDPSYIPKRAELTKETLEKEETDLVVVQTPTVEEDASTRFHREVAFTLNQIDGKIAVNEKEKLGGMTLRSRVETTLNVYMSLLWSAIRSYSTKRKKVSYSIALLVSLVFIFRGLRTLQKARV